MRYKNEYFKGRKTSYLKSMGSESYVLCFFKCGNYAYIPKAALIKCPSRLDKL